MNSYKGQALYTYDQVSTATSATLPSRTASWDDQTGPEWVRDLEYDACTDRIYLGSNRAFPTNTYLWAFDDASTLTGALDFTTDPAASITSQQALVLAHDATDRLWVFPDSAQYGRAFEDVRTWSGTVAGGTGYTQVWNLAYKAYDIDVDLVSTP